MVLDPAGKAPGRGAYVCADPACQQLAITRGALKRALDVPIPPGLFGLPAGPGTTIDDFITDHEGGS